MQMEGACRFGKRQRLRVINVTCTPIVPTMLPRLEGAWGQPQLLLLFLSRSRKFGINSLHLPTLD